MSQTDPESRGLELFDEKASAVRGFLTVLRGYDKKAVDDYVRDMEQQLAVTKKRYREMRRELTAASLRNDDTDFSKLGAHTASLLRVAESQAQDLVGRAQSEGERILAEAQEQADQKRLESEQAADHHRISRIDELRALRADLEKQTASELDAARAEAQGLREAADKHREMVLGDADRQANGLLEAARAEAAHLVQAAEHHAAELIDRATRDTNALRADTTAAVAEQRTVAEASATELRNRTAAEVTALRATVADETDALRAQVQAEVAELRERVAGEVSALRDQVQAEATQSRSAVAAERAASLSALEAEQRELRGTLSTLVGDARNHSASLLEELAQAATDLRSRQQAAYAEAERIKTDALTEAAAIVMKATHDAEAHRQETEGALMRRSDQLRREQNLLKQRKEALVAQLNNLSSLANLTALEFPDEDGNHPIQQIILEPADEAAPDEDEPIGQPSAEADEAGQARGSDKGRAVR